MNRDLMNSYLATLQLIHSEVKRARALLNRLEDQVEELKVAVAREERVGTYWRKDVEDERY
jgi:hypothetical protein